jgi:hypothetical protein
MDVEFIKTICIAVGAIISIVGGVMVICTRVEKQIDLLLTQQRADVASLMKKIDSVHAELKAEIADVKLELGSRMDRLEGRMDKLDNCMESLEDGQKELVKDMALMKNSESKLNFKMARWMFAKSIGKELEEVDSLLAE